MQNDLAWIEMIAPDFLNTIRQRYLILQRIQWMEPVGRRTLSLELDLSERVLRTETDFLKSSGLILSSKSGMVLTEAGHEILVKLDGLMSDLLGFPKKEKQLASILGIDHVLIVSGDSDQQPPVLRRLGQLLNNTLSMLLPDGRNVVAAMGGTTMAAVAKELTPLLSRERQLLFVPARGGIGELVDIQANAICSQMAQNTGGEHRSLYVPENVSERTYEPLLKEPSIKPVLDLIAHANVVIHSIGDAMTMASRRQMPADVIEALKAKQAVAEAFGYFFDETGQVVYKIPRVGLQIRDLNDIPYVFAVAAGAKKAKAIRAYMHNAPHQTWFITDEAAANSLLKGATF
ncbi:glycolytic regulator [Lapidilactobacillus concavus DSM 17758]|jgi:central glycolytic genes regulator|uniref:Glycolytic regulator n=1 Tax=Lapidilactobacillus concavus DSM 17758 TaxID=1423735 RepID=A0A0R1W2Y6_9LACO|nr:sugar-binding domain-containing protein [Lapidilactobacillus concavus]KRM09763.1 glycolytic regulator [Lapidilactobacillus concavus DSM 17758]GEL13512.1 central glycolytic genes regulator [Lapidilactobacillus concavus]